MRREFKSIAKAAVFLWLALSASAFGANYTIWPGAATPSTIDGGPDSAVELGVKFRVDSPGTITGIRFYKARTNTGTHVANLWSSGGTRLATATFSGETASGWQQVTLSPPVSVTANTIYIASYHTNTGHYSDDIGYFSGKGTDNAPLHALRDGASGYNGVYAYGSTSRFPTQGWKSSNYWVDVVFTPSGGADTTRPTVTAFTVPGTSTSLTVPITTLTATDNVGVTGYLVNESSATPSAAAAGWSSTAPASYSFATAGSKTLYAWAKDAAGNVSTSRSAAVTVTLPDTIRPTVTAFTVPATSSTLAVPITALTATDNVAVTGYLVNESSATPSASAAGWSASAPTTYTFATSGSKTLYAWAKDATGNVSASRSAPVTVSPGDTEAPTVTAFVLPSSSTSLTVTITTFTATDNAAVTGYLVTETSTKPSPTANGWSAAAPGAYTFTAPGSKTLYAWAKDAAGNVSASMSALVTITMLPEPVGWYAGDFHAHRSCGGAVEDVPTLFQNMNQQNLAVLALFADMGNMEVPGSEIELPKVTGQDDPISTPSRIVHFDAEWKWDATYTNFAHQALGGHLLALGLQEAHQIWEEYTYPIFEWAHAQNGIVGFAHMQDQNGGIPQTLDCCQPLEFPVEVALGAADFIEEDVEDLTYGDGVLADYALQSYYRLLNCGFRPGFAAGTDHPCNSPNANLGAMLTYVQVGGPLTYRGWIDGIARGRTVVSRNGHNEFLGITVNGSATPGDEVTLTGGGTVPVTVTWTAIQNISGTIELVQNGVVVASKQASITPGGSATLTASVAFARSGWLAARRMTNNGHAVHTAAVFVTVDNLPVRASAADANFFVQWINNLLTKTSAGGEWYSFFPNNRVEAQARYQAAKALYQQIAAEATASSGGGGGGGGSTSTIFTTQLPTLFENDASYELGTRFWSDVSGTITQVRIYTNDLEGGSHTVRIWRVQDTAVVAGPFTWNITAGTAGWETFDLPAPLTISANTDYIVSVSNSSDRYYAEQIRGFDASTVNGHLHTYPESGVYSVTPGAMPTSVWSNSNYFRDVVIAQ